MIKSLEGGRGLAALIVALYHLKIGVGYFSVVRNGYLFVDLFFVLSGFVICAAYWSRMSGMGDFWTFVIRRFGRLFPLLIFSTLVFVLAENVIVLLKRLAAANGYAGMLNNPDALGYSIPAFAEIVSTITMTHGMGVFDDLILNTPSWSISTEFYVYFLFAALCLLLAGTTRLAAFFVFSVAGFLISVWASTTVHDCLVKGGCLSLTYDFGFPRTVFSFFLGALAWQASRAVRLNADVLQVVGLLTLAVLLTTVEAFPALSFVFPLVFALLILSVCNDTGWVGRLLATRPFQMLGQRSYSIYLMHMPLVLFFENIAKRASGIIPGTLVVLAYVAVLIIISGWTYRFIEDPFRAVFNRYASGFRALRADAAIK